LALSFTRQKPKMSIPISDSIQYPNLKMAILDLAGRILMKNSLALHSLWALSDTREMPKMLMLNLGFYMILTSAF
jgi:hypothetical protein